jgi:cation diffusion facilitator family transporter
MPSEGPKTALKASDREKTVIRTSFIGIVANVFLAAFKLIIGFLSSSVAVVMDAVNNISDVLSSVVTIIGTKLANKRADRKHPMGHGRIEYLSTLIIAALVLYAGITALIESIKKIIDPVTPDYSVVSIVIIAVAVAVKVLLGLYVGKKGKDVDSDLLRASGKDALFDAILSASVLASVLIFVLSGVSLESYVGVLIGLFIIRSGIEILRNTLSKILGERPDPELTSKIKSLIGSIPGVRGAYDLVMNSYGPEKIIASVNIEVPENMSAADIDAISRQAQALVIKETGVILATVGVYSFNVEEYETGTIYNSIRETVLSHDWALEIHGLYVDNDAKLIRFDVVISFDVKAEDALAELYKEMDELHPDYDFYIVADADISD